MPFSQTHLPLYELKAGLFKGLSHPFRVRILELLVDGQEHTVSELQSATELEASHLSQHLAVLRRHRLVVSQRRGSHVHYRLAWPEVADFLVAARRLLTQMVASDTERLEHMAELPELAEG
ncbi:MAG TPA: helix-turn-helix transcriptional regulator [Candidatus Avipropionibacterium avicola]|uniref:Helix-turn-helix transcriptional regulator n=1 Tax=Candidatus Avipropionibacterium avicola TaxID=2840701 RepID=A0A9D1GWE9_9ACTN|nr:helix-turn-helix transcriptional regulator [Candidatus Avipropionibacterium avicola]